MHSRKHTHTSTWVNIYVRSFTHSTRQAHTDRGREKEHDIKIRTHFSCAVYALDCAQLWAFYQIKRRLRANVFLYSSFLVQLFYGLDLQSKQIAIHPVAVDVTANQTNK